jgi:hypothetical protein
MKCDKAQEFFSEYIEDALDRPMVVALESHLSGCESCSADVAGLRSMWTVLDQVPQVEPPADFVWRTTTRLQHEFLNKQEAQRAKALPWWKRLTPVQSFSYAGIAALLAIGIIQGPLMFGAQNWGFEKLLGLHRQQEMTAPNFEVQYPGANGVAASVSIIPTVEMQKARVWVSYLTPMENSKLVGHQQMMDQPRTLEANRPFTVPIMSGGSTAVRISVFVNDQGTDRKFEKTLLLPAAASQAVSVKEAQPEWALQQVADLMGQPVLVDAGFLKLPSLSVQGAQPQQALRQVMDQIDAKDTVSSTGVHMITANAK